jgi:Cof subfamily protein (haloacid dehalogenase superfamily)
MPTQYKLIALDIDGTILRSDHTIAPQTRAAIHQAMARGVRVTLATGRAFPSALAIARQLGLKGTPLVTHDGAYVADPDSGEVVHVERVDAEVAREAAVLLSGLGLNVSLIHEQVRICNQRIPNFRWGMLLPSGWKSFAGILRENRSYPHVYASDLGQYLQTSPVSPPKLWVTGRPERIAQAHALVAERLGSFLRTAKAGPGGMEVLLRHVSKATGLRALGAALSIRPEEIIGIGDGYNDVEMISQSGLGVAMGNAPEDVRRLAKFVTRTNDEHGVAHAIERFVLEQSA